MDVMRRIAEWAAFNGQTETCSAMTGALERAGYDVNKDDQFQRRKKFAEFRALVGELSYDNFPGFRCVVDTLVSLQVMYQKEGGQPASEWVSLHAKILFHSIMSVLRSCVVENIVDGVLAAKITMKPAFDPDDFEDMVDEVFAAITGMDAYGKKVFNKERNRLTNLLQEVEQKGTRGRARVVRSIDTEELANLFDDFRLSTFISTLSDFMRKVEAHVLPSTDLTFVPSAPSSAMKPLPSTRDWSEARRKSEGPYASNSPPAEDSPPTQPRDRQAQAKSRPTSPVRYVAAKGKPDNGSQAANLRHEASEFTKKNNDKDPLRGILNYSPIPTRSSRRSSGASVEDGIDGISPITSESDSRKRGPPKDTARSKAKRFNSPSRVGVRVPFDTQDEPEPEYEPMQHRSSSVVMNQIQDTLQTTKTSKGAMPNTLSPPRKNVQVTSGNVYTTAGAGRATRSDGNDLKRIRWSLEEEDLFIEGMHKHGRNQYAEILKDPEFALVCFTILIHFF